METSSITRRVLARASVTGWAWWQLPMALRVYVGAAPIAALTLAGYAASQTTWHTSQLATFLLLVACGLASVAATPKTAYAQGALVRDFITAWILPVAILLPPVYAMIAPVPLLILTQVHIHKGAVFRRVFTAAALSLGYGGASALFHAFPASMAGTAVGTGTHAFRWLLVVSICEIAGGRAHRLLILGAIKITDPSARLASEALSREALQADLTEFNLGVIITLIVAVNPLFSIFVAPLWLLVRRYMVHPLLLAQSRIDSKTGLLNAATWEKEATAEVARAVRTGTPLAVALVDIDHFKVVNDTYGHLAGDHVLRAVSSALQGQLRGYDLAGRFGGEEFIILLPHAHEADARNVAERLRTHIADMEVPADGHRDCPTTIRVTISVGVAALEGVSRELTDLMAAADSALYHAKEGGRNRTHVISANT
jgi:diguanylate cyclase (GGDEF)-like protein